MPVYPAEMRLVFRGENCDWWEAELRGVFHRLYYYFELVGDERLYYSGEVFFSEPSKERSEYFKFPFNHRADIARVPEWALDAVVYNIFPDSFASSRRSITGCGTEKRVSGALSRSRLGGTIRGICENLDYISGLGANCIYLNPIFAAGQYHKYDTIDYLHIDPCLGTDADFRQLVEECHARGMRVILDGVFNHCGAQFFAFRDVLEKQRESRYADWFYRLQFPVTYPEAGERPNYECFCYERLMPKLDTSNDEVRDYLCGVGEYWLREFDADGWRLDVADEPNDGFWREFRRRCKAVKSDALLIGEVWGGARHWLAGDMLDSTMNYDFRSHCRHFFAEGSIDARTFAGRCADMLMRYKRQITAAQLNLLDSHDTSRFLDICGGEKRRLLNSSALAAPGDPSLGQIVRAHFQLYVVAFDDPDIVHPKLARNISRDRMTVGKLHLECGVGQRFDHFAFRFDYIVFRHRNSLRFFIMISPLLLFFRPQRVRISTPSSRTTNVFS